MLPPLKKIRQISGQSRLNFNTSAVSGKLIVGAAGDSVDVTARSAPVPACVFGDDVYIKFEPEMDGNCQFNCLAEQLNAFGHGSLDANAVRSVIVSNLRDKARPEMMGISNFVPDCDVETYCNKMAKCGEYGDHITLQVAAHFYHIRILVLSNRGSAYDAIVTDTSCTTFELSSPIVLLGHYTEEEGTHYVGLASKCEVDELLSSRLPTPVKIPSIASVSRETVNPDDGTTVVNTSTGINEMHPEVESLVFKPLSEPTTVAGSTSFIDAQVVNDGIDHLSDRVARTSTSITPISQPHHITDTDNLPIHKSGKRTRKFCVDWYKQFPWLHWEGGCLLCYSCATANRQLGSTLNQRSEHAFVTTGYSCNWKKAVDNFAQHEKSVQHHESCEKLALIKDNVNVSHLLDKHHKEEQASARRALHAVVTTLLTLAHTGSAIRGHKMNDGNLMEWLNLRAQEVPELASLLQRRVSFISGDIQNELLSLMHNDVLRQIISDVNQSPYFAVIMDETTDISTKEQVSICIRYLKDSLTPVETFIGLYEVTSTTGENLCQVLMDVLHRCGLSIKCLRAQCYDGASNMSGAFRGVQARVKELQPLAIYVHCYAHSLNLVLQETARQVPIIRDSLEYLHRAAVLMGRSAKRKSILHAWSAAIKPICPTRWSVRAQAVTTALDNYEGILNALDEVATDSTNEASCVEASSLHAQFSKTQMFFCLLVAQAVFQPADRLSTALQSVKMTATSGLEAVKATHAMISSLRTDASFDKFIDKAMIAKNELRLDDMVQPRNRKPPKRIDSGAPACELTVTEYFRQQYFMLIDTLTSCLDRRFTNNGDLQAYALAEDLLLCHQSDHADLEWLEAECMRVTAFFNDVDSKGLAKDISSMSKFLQTTNKKLLEESRSVINFTSIKDYSAFLYSKGAPFQALFPQLVKLMQLLLIVPATSASAERSFSCLRRVKTWLRSTMTQDRLNSVALLHANRCLTPNLNTVLGDFIGLNDLRRRVFGSVNK